MMGNSFILINTEYEEYITFLGYSKEREIIGNKIPSQMVAYYLFEHNGNEIYYVGDQWNVGLTWMTHEKVVNEYKDVTRDILDEMIEEGYFTEEDLDKMAPWWCKTYPSSPTKETEK